MKSFLSLIFIFCSFFTFSQSKISGVLRDSLGVPVPFATIGLISLPDSIVKGVLGDENGTFSFNNPSSGNYLLEIRADGYTSKIINNITIDTSTEKEISISVILSPSLNVLDDITVRAVKRVIKFENGNIIVNVENSPLAKGNSVFELLTKLPGISIIDNKIMMQGKSGTIVMIDGRPQTITGDQLINLLKSMSADLVSSIEILKNPSVKYDATGSSGMINIKSKKVTISGVTGSVFSSFSQGFYGRLLSGYSLNYKSKKIVLFSNVSGNYSHYRMNEKLNREFMYDSVDMILKSNGIVKDFEQNINYKAGFDWTPTNRDLIGIKLEGGPGSYKSNTNSEIKVSGDNNLGFDYMNTLISQPNQWNSNNLDLNYSHQIDTLGSVFSFVTDISKLTDYTSSGINNLFYNLNQSPALPANNYKTDNNSSSNMYSGRADLTKFIDSTSNFEIGIKSSYTKTSNNYIFERDLENNAVYTKDTNLSSQFQYTELTYAGYVNYIKSFKKISMHLGARLEKTYLTGQNDKNFKLHREYFNIFPNFSFDYLKNENHDFQLNLSRRIDRPFFANLNPFKVYHDQYSLQQGNPFLLPDYTTRGELTYNYQSSFSGSIAYSNTQRIMMDYTSQNDSTKVMFQSVKNMKSCNSLEYSIYYEKSITNKWNLSASGTFANLMYKGDIDGVDFKRIGITYFGNISNMVLIGEKSSLEINGIYFGPNVLGIIQVKYRWMASIAFKTKILKDRVDVTLGIDDIFHTLILKSNTNFENQNWNYNANNDTQRFRIALSYKFGKMKIEEREIGSSNEDEKVRLKH